MPNTLLTPSWTLKEVGRGYENKVKFVANMTRKYSDEFKQEGAKVGNTINYRLPHRWTVSDGSGLDVQGIQDQTVPISLTNQKHIDMAWSAWEEATEIDDVKRRFIDPASDSIASVVDALAITNCYRDVFNSVGTPGTTPSTNMNYLSALEKLKDFSCPDDGLVAILDIRAMITLVNANLTLFNPASKISEQYRKGMFGRDALGVSEWYESQNRPTFTTGATTTATPLVDGAGQTGSTININGWGSGNTTLKKGDVITIAGVESVNRLTGQATGRLQQFVITADTADSSGATATLPISPSIITSGAYQTVSASPANDAVVTYWSMTAGGSQTATSSPTSLVYHPEAFAFVTADLAKPKGGAVAAQIGSKARGVALRMVTFYDGTVDQNITRIDTIVGAATLRPEWACRSQG